MKHDSEPQLPGLADTTKLSLAPAKGREEPAVWLRKLAVHSDWPTATGTLLREIVLHRGLNVLWAEPAPRGMKNRVSGHATGKTTFCRLVRYILNDADAGTKDFRQRFQAKFPRGWVLGEVVVGGVPWLVGRPLGHQGFHPFARKNGTLADATGAQPLRGNFEDYEAALAEVTLGHDSPREADLTEAIYEELFRAAVELEAGVAEGEAPFQYIITTTQPPPDELKRAPWLLHPVLNATEATGRFLGVDL